MRLEAPSLYKPEGLRQHLLRVGGETGSGGHFQPLSLRLWRLRSAAGTGCCRRGPLLGVGHPHALSEVTQRVRGGVGQNPSPLGSAANAVTLRQVSADSQKKLECAEAWKGASLRAPKSRDTLRPPPSCGGWRGSTSRSFCSSRWRLVPVNYSL